MDRYFKVTGHYSARPQDSWSEIVKPKFGNTERVGLLAMHTHWDHLGIGTRNWIGLVVDKVEEVTEADYLAAKPIKPLKFHKSEARFYL